MPRASKKKGGSKAYDANWRTNLAARVLLDSSSDEDGSLADDLD